MEMLRGCYCSRLTKRSYFSTLVIGFSISVIVSRSQTELFVLLGARISSSGRPRNGQLRIANEEGSYTQKSQHDANQMYQIFEKTDGGTSDGSSYYAVVTQYILSVPTSSNLHIPCLLSGYHSRNNIHQSFPFLTTEEDHHNVSHDISHMFTHDPFKYIILKNRKIDCKDSRTKTYIQTNILTIKNTSNVTRNTPIYKLRSGENFSCFSKIINPVTNNSSSKVIIVEPSTNRSNSFLCSSFYQDSNGMYRRLRQYNSVDSSDYPNKTKSTSTGNRTDHDKNDMPNIQYKTENFPDKTVSNFSDSLGWNVTTSNRNNHKKRDDLLHQQQVDESLRDNHAPTTSDPSVNVSVMNDPSLDEDQLDHGYLTIVEAWIAICSSFIIIVVVVILCSFYCLPSLVSCRYCVNNENNTINDNINNILQDFDDDSYYNNDEESITIATTADSHTEDENDCCAATTSINDSDDTPSFSLKEQANNTNNHEV